MNKKVKELAKQAKAFIIEPEHASVGGVSEVSFDKYEDLEKFAELILKEVFNACDVCEPQANPEYVLCEMFGIDHNWRLLDE
jgi:hypothetical protein